MDVWINHPLRMTSLESNLPKKISNSGNTLDYLFAGLESGSNENWCANFTSKTKSTAAVTKRQTDTAKRLKKYKGNCRPKIEWSLQALTKQNLILEILRLMVQGKDETNNLNCQQAGTWDNLCNFGGAIDPRNQELIWLEQFIL